jgi:hypothetical protein
MLLTVGRNIILLLSLYRHGTRQTQRESEHKSRALGCYGTYVFRILRKRRDSCLFTRDLHCLVLILRKMNPIPYTVLIFNLMLFCHAFISYKQPFSINVLRPPDAGLCLCVPSSIYQSEETKVCCRVNTCRKGF